MEPTATTNNGVNPTALVPGSLDVSDLRKAFAEYIQRREIMEEIRGRYIAQAPRFVRGVFTCAGLLNTEPIHNPMNTNPELLAAICAEPAEDTPRMIYADWLDEHASEQPSELREGYTAHAELIRIQCAMARAPACPVCKKLGRFRGTHLKFCETMGIDVRDTDVNPAQHIDIECTRCNFYAQHNRVRFLLSSKYATEGRIKSLPPPKVKGEELWKPAELAFARETRYVRGFVGIASFKCGAFFAWADKIGRAAPLQALYLTDKNLPSGPRVHGKIGYLFCPDDMLDAERVELCTSPMVIPETLWELAHSFRTKDVAEGVEDCYAWLSMACVTHLRRKAKLPDILPPSASALYPKPRPNFPAFVFGTDGQPLKLPPTVDEYTSDGLYTQHALMGFASGDPELLEYKGFCDARLLDTYRGLFGVTRYTDWAPPFM